MSFLTFKQNSFSLIKIVEYALQLRIASLNGPERCHCSLWRHPPPLAPDILSSQRRLCQHQLPRPAHSRCLMGAEQARHRAPSSQSPGLSWRPRGQVLSRPECLRPDSEFLGGGF